MAEPFTHYAAARLKLYNSEVDELVLRCTSPSQAVWFAQPWATSNYPVWVIGSEVIIHHPDYPFDKTESKNGKTQ